MVQRLCAPLNMAHTAKASTAGRECRTPFGFLGSSIRLRASSSPGPQFPTLPSHTTFLHTPPVVAGGRLCGSIAPAPNGDSFQLSDRGTFGRRPGYGIPHHRQHGGPGPPLSALKKGGQAAQALGRSRGGFSTKVHVSVDSPTPQRPFLQIKDPQVTGHTWCDYDADVLDCGASSGGMLHQQNKANSPGLRRDTRYLGFLHFTAALIWLR